MHVPKYPSTTATCIYWWMSINHNNLSKPPSYVLFGTIQNRRQGGCQVSVGAISSNWISWSWSDTLRWYGSYPVLMLRWLFRLICIKKQHVHIKQYEWNVSRCDQAILCAVCPSKGQGHRFENRIKAWLTLASSALDCFTVWLFHGLLNCFDWFKIPKLNIYQYR